LKKEKYIVAQHKKCAADSHSPLDAQMHAACSTERKNYQSRKVVIMHVEASVLLISHALVRCSNARCLFNRAKELSVTEGFNNAHGSLKWEFLAWIHVPAYIFLML